MKTENETHEQPDAPTAKGLEQRIARLLSIAQPTMEAWAPGVDLEEWHIGCAILTGTAYPKSLCPECSEEMAANVRDGRSYSYCPNHGEPRQPTVRVLRDLWGIAPEAECEPND